MTEFDSSLEFVGDLMQFVMSYFDVNWSPPEETRGKPLPIIRFTRTQAEFIHFTLEAKWEFWEMMENSPSFVTINHDSFLNFAFFMKEDLEKRPYSTSTFLLFATYISFMAALAVKRGFLNAPTYAMAIIYEAISSFHLGRALSFSNSVRDTTTRRIL